MKTIMKFIQSKITVCSDKIFRRGKKTCLKYKEEISRRALFEKKNVYHIISHHLQPVSHSSTKNCLHSGMWCNQCDLFH